jgi:hypothetical protein
MNVKATSLVLLAILTITTSVRAAEPDAVARREIAYLIDHLAASGCQFNRNGTWHDAPRAVSHLRRKYEYLLKKNMVPDADAFIRLAASESSTSGKPYLVKCADQPETPSAEWFRVALRKIRKHEGA